MPLLIDFLHSRLWIYRANPFLPQPILRLLLPSSIRGHRGVMRVPHCNSACLICKRVPMGNSNCLESALMQAEKLAKITLKVRVFDGPLSAMNSCLKDHWYSNQDSLPYQITSCYSVVASLLVGFRPMISLPASKR